MTRFRLIRRRPADPDLSAAKRQTAASGLRAEREYRTSVERLADSQQVAHELLRHNDANRYADWLERAVLRGAR